MVKYSEHQLAVIKLLIDRTISDIVALPRRRSKYSKHQLAVIKLLKDHTISPGKSVAYQNVSTVVALNAKNILMDCMCRQSLATCEFQHRKI